ncbi:MAG: hypothetical protein ACJAVK_002387, partial [Akkermansiaceae bacterium]
YRPFDGLIDEFAIYETVLDADVISSHYTAALSAPLINITDIDFDSESDTVSITWTSEPGRTYGLFYSQDLRDWGSDIEDSIPSQGDTTVFEFQNPIPEATKIFFRVE